MSLRESRDAVSRRARDILRQCGFERVGIADAGSTPRSDLFREWIDRGLGAGMDWLARSLERRCDVESVLPGTRSVLVQASPYGGGASPGIARPDPRRAEISSYARGPDYHRVIERRLRRARARLEDEIPGSYRYYVDTGPVLEKAWAERAGIGWIGKNTCSIHPTEGSWFFLSVILTDVELAPDPPALDHCGSCRLCQDACPTGALDKAYVLDARRCISYWTIEHRGEIPPEISRQHGNLVFGCDICQEVCPFNARNSEAPESGEPGDSHCRELGPRPENHSPRLEQLARLRSDTFAERFPMSAVRRAGWKGFLRNVVLAMGNSGRPEYSADLERLASEEAVRDDPTLRRTLEVASMRLVRGKIEADPDPTAPSEPTSNPAPPGDPETRSSTDGQLAAPDPGS